MSDAAPACTFCRLFEGEGDEPHIVLSDPDAVAFLDHRPLFPGHVLLAPRAHYETLTDLPHDLVGPIFERAQRLARAVQAAMEAEGTFVAINNRVSQTVPHLHIHVVPRRRKDGLRGFFWPRTRYRDPAHMTAVRDRIRAELARADG